MRSFTFFERVYRAFRDHDQSQLKLVLLCTTVSGGGLLAYGEAVGASEAAVTDKKKVVVLGTARSIVEPVRNIFRKKKVDVEYSEAECVKIDAANRKVYCRSNRSNNSNVKEEFVVDYDYLIIAVGANVNTFNTPGVVENCHFLKEVEDAQKIRRTVIDCFERASLPSLSEEENKRILHFSIVGGGQTGVEFAAALHDFVIEDLVRLYPGIKDLVKITLLPNEMH
ncbi:external alternative NAD(P)H-ubiquinone oxidoreductase B2, mitochondrial-like [Gastrolobium bilobum]|uniref:external alternative NAD(P)H-ubiquinone oxidoreductase B2, mitochondrial-like n=1 Tax=Gastrolobium bilobum TaxID=150636 RepID=UPI002AB0AB9E|nr:external alternative NAD(P)H-ubiquinone oxidoreductase B2, mitochondrial-like [Gastrolobium bilobum]